MPTEPLLPDNENARLNALYECNVLDTEAEPTFDALTASAVAVCHTPVALISLLDQGRQWFKARSGTELKETPRNLAFCGHAILTPEMMVVEDAREDPRFYDHPLVVGPPFIRFYAGMPLELSTGERLGTLCTFDTRPRELSSEQYESLRVLGLQGTAMLELRRKVFCLERSDAEKAALIEELREAQRSLIAASEARAALGSAEMTIFALARLAEARDGDTGRHLDRVRTYCSILARQLHADSVYASQIDDDFINLICATSPLHDIGKVAIPDCVLLKAGRLTNEEFEMMKTHTTEGAATLEDGLQKYPDARFFRMARDIALTHHEKFNGTGYPHGLAGTDIPLCGRIVALADVYDAMTSKRVYKGAYSHAIARSTIVEEAGSHFDPEIVKAFLATEDQFEAVRRDLNPAAADHRAAA